MSVNVSWPSVLEAQDCDRGGNVMAAATVLAVGVVLSGVLGVSATDSWLVLLLMVGAGYVVALGAYVGVALYATSSRR